MIGAESSATNNIMRRRAALSVRPTAPPRRGRPTRELRLVSPVMSSFRRPTYCFLYNFLDICCKHDKGRRQKVSVSGGTFHKWIHRLLGKYCPKYNFRVSNKQPFLISPLAGQRRTNIANFVSFFTEFAKMLQKRDLKMPIDQLDQ